MWRSKRRNTKTSRSYHILAFMKNSVHANTYTHPKKYDNVRPDPPTTNTRFPRSISNDIISNDDVGNDGIFVDVVDVVVVAAAIVVVVVSPKVGDGDGNGIGTVNPKQIMDWFAVPSSYEETNSIIINQLKRKESIWYLLFQQLSLGWLILTLVVIVDDDDDVLLVILLFDIILQKPSQIFRTICIFCLFLFSIHTLGWLIDLS
jgi:hypothetical protein